MTDHPAEPTLFDKVDELTAAAERLTDAVERETSVREAETAALRLKLFTARRAIRIAVATMVFGFIATLGLFALGWHWVDEYRHDQAASAVVSCRNANESRQAIEDRMEQLVAQLGAVNTPSDPTAAAVRQQLIDKFLADFRASMPPALKARDCSPQAATSPTLVQR